MENFDPSGFDINLAKRQQSAFEKKGVTNALQLRRWLPIRYIDNSKETGISPVLIGQHVVVIATMTEFEKKRMRSRAADYIQLSFQDRKSKEPFKVAYFGEFNRYKTYHQYVGKEFLICGELDYNPKFGYSINKVDTTSGAIKKNMKIVPMYSKIKGISSEKLCDILTDLARQDEADYIPREILKEEGLPEINETIRALMSPSSGVTDAELLPYRKRLLFDDFLYLAGRLALEEKRTKVWGAKITTFALADSVISSLPYSLTAGQRDTYDAIRKKMLEGKRFSALVQGDVGAGKTIIAFLSMILIAENGQQACLMAPTKILAEQHYQKLSALLADTDLECVCLSGGIKKTSDEIKGIRDGKIKLVIGTTSILSDSVEFNSLSLMVVDEEHKFGVVQREKIENRRTDIDYISMSATPIPRTLASALFGDHVDVYSIKDKPAGRKDVITYYDDGRKVLQFIRQVLASGHQVYVVCPAIDMDDDTEIKMTTTAKMSESLSAALPGYSVAEMTGDMEPEESERILHEFKENRIHVLVSTTVVEVGIDVPNATLIVICNAERFGLASLHQLRGRVGRGKDQAYCILQSKQSPAENQRLLTLCQTNDGFEIAEKDLLYLRKSGDLFGEQQSGKNQYIEEMLLYPEYYKRVKALVSRIPTDLLQKHIQKMQSVENPKRTRFLPQLKCGEFEAGS